MILLIDLHKRANMIKYKSKWYNSNKVWKRRVASYYSFAHGIIVHKPLIYAGMVIGFIFRKMPISFSSSLKQSLKITTNMPLSLDIKVAVDQMKDHGRAQFCNKERLTCKWIEKYYKKGDVIYDIGANIGAVSLLAAMYLERDCEIYSFEPLPTTFSMLFKNIMLNNCDNVITPLNIALSDKVKKDKFHLTSISAGTSGHSVSSSVNDIVESYHINRPNHIKIDVDGHDYEVLLGGKKNIFNNNSLKTILIEKNDKENEIRSLVKQHGFVEVELNDPKEKYENMGFIREGYN